MVKDNITTVTFPYSQIVKCPIRPNYHPFNFPILRIKKHKPKRWIIPEQKISPLWTGKRPSQNLSDYSSSGWCFESVNSMD